MKNKIWIVIIILIAVNGIVLFNYNKKDKISNYQTAIKAGFVGSEKEWIESIKGDSGKNGTDGYTPIKGVDYFDGLAGNNGLNGIDGKDGAKGANGTDGYTPIKGVDYFDGLAGTDGLNGIDGKDGAKGANGDDGYTPIKGVDYFDGLPGADGGISSVDIDTPSNVSGLLKGINSKIAAAVADVDYLTPGAVGTNYLKLDASNGPIIGNLLIKNSANSVSNFEVQNKDGNTAFSVNTTNNRVGINTASPSDTFDLLGTARFGDHTTNYSQFEADGTLKMNGNATIWDDLRVQLLTRTGSAAPIFTAGFGGNANLYAYYFKRLQTNNVYFEVQLPHGWSGSKIYPHVHWSPTTTNTGTVKWILEYTWVNINGTFGATQTIEMESNVITNSQWKHLMAINENGLTPTTSQNGISSMMICRLYRAAGSNGDNYDSDAALVAFDLHYEMDTIGSRTTVGK